MKEKRATRLSCERARAFPIERALAKLGHFPTKTNDKEAWFLSPLRLETQASFKVSKKLNRWYDHGEGTGGNVIDLICKMKNCTVREALKIIGEEQTSFSFQQQNIIGPEKQGTKISILKVLPITHFALRSYLGSRGISIKTAIGYVKEVHYRFWDKNYFAIGLKNDSGGWELRNKYLKNCSSPKDSAHIKNGNEKLIVTEGMFDLLSILEGAGKSNLNHDFLILNSTAFLRKAMNVIEDYNQIDMYLDNDQNGKEITQKLMARSNNCIDKSKLYEGFKDINEWSVKSAKDEVRKRIQDVSLS